MAGLRDVPPKPAETGPYMSRAPARFLRNLAPWHTWFFTLQAPIMFFPIYFFSNM